MDRNSEKLLTQHEVNLRILSKEERTYTDKDILNVSGRYRDEDYAIYKAKRNQFYDSVKQYRNLNHSALKTNKFKSDIDGDISLKFEFLDEVDEFLPEVYTPGVVLRKRTLREIHSIDVNEDGVSKCMGPWFRRYWILSRFIRAARQLIVKNRMLKRLEKLQSVTPSMIRRFSLEGFRVINETYPELFEKFLKPKISEADSSSTL